jgi:hypothetical protein
MRKVINLLGYGGTEIRISYFSARRYTWSIAGETSKRRMNSLHFFGVLDERRVAILELHGCRAKIIRWWYTQSNN